jgi:putative hydrolase
VPAERVITTWSEAELLAWTRERTTPTRVTSA